MALSCLGTRRTRPKVCVLCPEQSNQRLPITLCPCKAHRIIAAAFTMPPRLHCTRLDFLMNPATHNCALLCIPALWVMIVLHLNWRKRYQLSVILLFLQFVSFSCWKAYGDGGGCHGEYTELKCYLFSSWKLYARKKQAPRTRVNMMSKLLIVLGAVVALRLRLPNCKNRWVEAN
jgi:hypothetical protein